MQTSLTLKVVSAHKLVGVDSGGTCDPYFILEANDKNFNKVNYKSKKYKKALNPNYNESLFLSGVTRKQIIKGEFVGKPVVIDFFDWNQFQKHTFLGRALIELTPEFFVQGDTVKLTLPLKELKAGENYLTNSKVKKTKSGQITSPVSEAKGKSKQNLQFSGLGTVEVEITLDDQNIPEEELARMHTLVQLSTEKITSLYAAFKKSSKENIKDVPEFIKILNDSNLFEAVMTKWNGSDPTANEHWHLLSKDKDFMEILCSNLFHAFDVDGDGNISFEEACNGLYSLLEGNSDAALRMRFRSIDLDRSGYIDMAEAKVLGGKTMAVIRCGFMIGLNAKKYEMIQAGLSERDFLPILDAIDKAFTQNNYAEKEAKLLFKYADKDENGKISEDEYVAYMQDPVAIAKRTRDLEEVMKPVQASMQKNVQAALIQLITRIQNRY